LPAAARNFGLSGNYCKPILPGISWPGRYCVACVHGDRTRLDVFAGFN
jgi:hypothetical protein